jgi:hypothetical protein
MIKALKIAAVSVAVPAIVLGSVPQVFAAAAGQFETGDFYYGKNDTKNSDYVDPVTADPCDTITLKMRLHNPGPSELHDVNVKATVPSGEGTSFSSVATVTAPDGDPQVVTDSVAIKLSKSAKISYIAGSTQLLDAHSGAISTIPDGAIQNGVNIGNVGVSIEQKRFVQFKLKVDCPTPPPVTPPTTPTTPTNPVAPKELPKTGAGDVVAVVAGATILGAIAHRLFTSRRLSNR